MKRPGTIIKFSINHCFFIAVVVCGCILSRETTNGFDGTAGHELCPCLSREDINEPVYIGDGGNFSSQVGDYVNFEDYGVGTCEPHDENSIPCREVTNCSLIVPLPRDCEKSWCTRSWCFVDPSNCQLAMSPSVQFVDRYFSYATCGEMDSFTWTERLKSLQDKTLRVGFNKNSGGWKGAYNPDGHFAVNKYWKGPVYDFVKQASQEAGFTIMNTAPPEFLRNKSISLFGHDSSFDLCVYATSLGYLDFCVAAFTVTEKRASVTTFYETTSDPIYLVIFQGDESKMSWNNFALATRTIFQPFTGSAWLMIWFFALPVLGLLMLLHEYGTPGGAYPNEEPVLVTDKTTGQSGVSVRKIPMARHCLAALYRGALAFFQGSYDLAVVTIGGKLNLLAIAAFIMLILSIYTANLAAILTQNLHSPAVDSIDAALQAGYNFCAERKVTEIVMDVFGVEGKHFVPDPVDGQPGFLAGNAREKVFDAMELQDDADKSRYCKAAIASLEDLQALHQSGKHCDKLRVGEAIHQQAIGIPISPVVDDALVSLFHQIKIEGTMEKALRAAQPADRCNRSEEGEEGSSLSIKQLTGVWVLTFSLAVAGLVARCFADPNSLGRRRRPRNAPASSGIQLLRRVDQWGNATDVDESDLVSDTSRCPNEEEDDLALAANDDGLAAPSSDSVNKSGSTTLTKVPISIMTGDMMNSERLDNATTAADDDDDDGSKHTFGNDRFSWW